MQYRLAQEEGQGATVRRSIGGREVSYFDPFLLLDAFEVQKPAGFPDHPHRGFETVTYMTEGKFQHEDFCGHRGEIRSGDLQWMTAGRGIVHAEMPSGYGVNKGLQLWVNLSETNKLVEPSYQELLDKDIPKININDNKVQIKVIAGRLFKFSSTGESHGTVSPVRTRTPTIYLDFTMKENAFVEQKIPNEYNVFVYILTGEGYFNKAPGSTNQTLIFNQEGMSKKIKFVGDFIKVETKDSQLRFVLIAGMPLGEPVARQGPFVMNTKEELQKAFEDYFSFKNGFEKAKNWESQISRNSD
ncbi:RmlC-like jelly roll fold domain-containing protein [Rozella allomycis CSF55]|uniref:RmlC-like jelly roll fold domain-containing protein n=1 Tax=Rozella allomycis (strain CSF55) TaxID=988480 RepID=A0A075AQN4_ROZAC|nr:RmlC-like jelly roll fold domain-containing protein [Rozella allomycis CSF55]|eukprot:EPZ32561.1 RmlC-like jelly roll fold domain-containing protein [Rozella allomycis CSF55]